MNPGLLVLILLAIVGGVFLIAAVSIAVLLWLDSRPIAVDLHPKRKKFVFRDSLGSDQNPILGEYVISSYDPIGSGRNPTGVDVYFEKKK